MSLERLRASPTGRPAEALAALVAAQPLDAHHRVHLAESWALAGDIGRHCPFLAPLRGTPQFDAIAGEARRLTAEFRAAEAAS